MRSLNEIRIVKDFIITINALENMMLYAGNDRRIQIETYICERIIKGNAPEIDNFPVDINDKEEIKAILNDMDNNEYNVSIRIENRQGLGIFIHLSQEEVNEYCKTCSYYNSPHLEEDLVKLEEDFYVSRSNENKYAKAVDDNKYHLKINMWHIIDNGDYIYSRAYLEEHCRNAIDDSTYHYIENMTKVHLESFYDMEENIGYVYSEEYLDEKFAIPIDKNEYYYRDRMQYIEETNEYVFDRGYLRNNFHCCNECEDWFPDDGYEHGRYLSNYGIWVCDDCLDTYYPNSCEICGDRIREEDECYETDEYGDDITVCPNCIDNDSRNRIDKGVNVSNLIGSYHFNHGIWTNYKLENEENIPFYLGFELEIEPKRHTKYNISETAQTISRYINCIMSNDSSLRKNNCGLHFHVTAPRENRDEIVNRLWLIIETYKEEFQKLSRRKGNFEWCQFLSGNKEEMKSIYKIAKISKEAKDETRYLVINDRNDKTIEIRLFRGTLNINTFFATVQLVNNLFTLAYDLDKKIEDITFSMLTEGDYISKYCIENDISSDKVIVDDSIRYLLTEKKILNLSKNILDIMWKEIEESKENLNKRIMKKTCNSFKNKYEYIQEIDRITDNIKSAISYYSNIHSHYRNKNVDGIYSNICIYKGYIKLSKDKEEIVKKKLEKIKSYYSELQ